MQWWFWGRCTKLDSTIHLSRCFHVRQCAILQAFSARLCWSWPCRQPHTPIHLRPKDIINLKAMGRKRKCLQHCAMVMDKLINHHLLPLTNTEVRSGRRVTGSYFTDKHQQWHHWFFSTPKPSLYDLTDNTFTQLLFWFWLAAIISSKQIHISPLPGISCCDVPVSVPQN